MTDFRKQFNKLLFIAGVALCSLLMISCHPTIPEEVAQYTNKLPADLDFNEHVKPILSDKCFLCHGPDKAKQKAGLNLSDPDLAFLKLESGNRALVAGNISRSALVDRILETDEMRRMPPIDSHRSLSDYEKAVLIRWIEEGAEYKKHWALVPPEKRGIPEVNNKNWPHNEIDYFVLEKMEQKGWKPEPEAQKELLLRRVTFDLTGLPPNLKEIDNFNQDTSSNAYE